MSNEDLEAAARAARYLVSMSSIIRSPRSTGATVAMLAKLRLELDDLNEKFPEAREAIRKVTMELRLTRNAAVRLGDFVAPTAHEVAIETLFALNRERFGVEVDNRKRWETWPDVDELMAEIELELTRAISRRNQEAPAQSVEERWSVEKPKSEWREILNLASTTFRKDVSSGKLVIKSKTKQAKRCQIRFDILCDYIGEKAASAYV